MYGINDALGIAACELASLALVRYCQENAIYLAPDSIDRLTPFFASYYITALESPNTTNVCDLYQASLLLLHKVWCAPVINLSEVEEGLVLEHAHLIIPWFHRIQNANDESLRGGEDPPLRCWRELDVATQPLELRGGGDNEGDAQDMETEVLLECPYKRHGCTATYRPSETRRFGSHQRTCKFKAVAATRATNASALPTANATVRAETHRFQGTVTARTDWAVSSQEAVLGYRKTTLFHPGTVPEQIRRLRREEAELESKQQEEAEEQQTIQQDTAESELAKQMEDFGLGASEIDDILYDADGGYESDASGAEEGLIEGLIGATEWDAVNAKLPSLESIANSQETPVMDPNSHLEPIYIAFVDLLSLLTKHNSNLKLFDEVVVWIEHFDRNYPNIWKSIDKHHKTTRSSLLRMLRKRYYRTNLLPELKVVDSPYTSKKYSVPVFDFKAVILSLLNDRKINSHTNLNQYNMDPITWRPIRAPPGLPGEYKTTAANGIRPTGTEPPEVDIAQPLLIGDIYSGTMIHHAIHMHVDALAPPSYGDQIDCVRPLPVIMFIDESHTDLHGSLKVTPVSLTLGSFPIRCRRKKEFWRNIAFLPPMDAGEL